MSGPLCPALYQINTRVWMTELFSSLSRTAALEDVPDTSRPSSPGTDFAALGAAHSGQAVHIGAARGRDQPGTEQGTSMTQWRVSQYRGTL